MTAYFTVRVPTTLSAGAKKPALILALAGAPLLATAAPWSGELSLGYIATQGNSQTQSHTGRVQLVYDQAPWKNTFTGSSLTAGDDTGSTAERYAASDKLDYTFGASDNYAFGLVDYELDLFGGVREKTSEVLGYGRHLLRGPVHTLDAEIGAGARQQEDQAGERTDEVIGRLSGTYKWAFSGNDAFNQTVKVESGRENTAAESVSELRLGLFANVSAIGAFTVRHNTNVPDGTENTDLTTSASLAYTFGRE